ncbi:MAG TPA: hypothetical protein VNW25_04150 [Candidatus Sulfotelmatobacter sp.]|nr:hypothetical protein [Candidatus Sulfotelmatobacter sp.]
MSEFKRNDNVTPEEVKSLPKKWRSLLLLVVIIAATAGGLSGAYYFGLFNTRHVLPSVHFTISESNQGFNDSVTHSSPWPIMNVYSGQIVTILVENNDTVSSHGFVINHYFGAGVSLRPGESHNITFVANQTGSYLVYCNIVCPVHTSMQYGQLEVNS